MGHHSTEPGVDVVSDPAAEAAHRRQIMTYAVITVSLIAMLLILVLEM
ncbi:hypothetical protein ACWDTI_17895 [Gordonia sp. NPDC003424]